LEKKQTSSQVATVEHRGSALLTHPPVLNIVQKMVTIAVCEQSSHLTVFHKQTWTAAADMSTTTEVRLATLSLLSLTGCMLQSGMISRTATTHGV